MLQAYLEKLAKLVTMKVRQVDLELKVLKVMAKKVD